MQIKTVITIIIARYIIHTHTYRGHWYLLTAKFTHDSTLQINAHNDVFSTSLNHQVTNFWLSLSLCLSLSETLIWTLKFGLRPKFNFWSKSVLRPYIWSKSFTQQNHFTFWLSLDLDRTSAQRKAKSNVKVTQRTLLQWVRFPLCWSELFQCPADIADEFAEQQVTVTIDILDKHCPIHKRKQFMSVRSNNRWLLTDTVFITNFCNVFLKKVKAS